MQHVVAALTLCARQAARPLVLRWVVVVAVGMLQNQLTGDARLTANAMMYCSAAISKPQETLPHTHTHRGTLDYQYTNRDCLTLMIAARWRRRRRQRRRHCCCCCCCGAWRRSRTCAHNNPEKTATHTHTYTCTCMNKHVSPCVVTKSVK